MSCGVSGFLNQFFGYRVGLILALPLFVLNDAALQIESLFVDRGVKVAHAIGFGEQRVIDSGGRDVLEVVGPVLIGGAVEIGSADLLHRFDVAAFHVLTAAEHEVLKKMGKAGFPGLLILRADVIPDIDGDDGRLVILVNQNSQAVR